MGVSRTYRFVDRKAKHLQERTVVEGTAERPQRRIWIDQSWLSNAPRTQATTRTNQSYSYFEQDDDHDAYGDLPDSYIDDNKVNSYATQSWSTPSPSYDAVRRPELL